MFIVLGVLEYFNANWHNCQSQWVKFHFLKHHCFYNLTNNRSESLNQKLKSVIAKYSKLTAFFSTLMACIGSLNIEKDIRAAEAEMKQPTRISVYKPHDLKYKRFLTPFAFEKYTKQSEESSTVQFIDIDDKFAASGSSNLRILTRSVNCDCEFFTSMGIVCKHILAFRRHNGMELFAEETCLNRWTNKHFSGVLNLDYSVDNPAVETIQTEKQRKRKKTYNEKYREAKKQSDTLCTLMAELPANKFKSALKQFEIFVNMIQDGEIPTVTADLSRMSTSQDSDDSARKLFICIFWSFF